jgi:hypothetical protein
VRVSQKTAVVSENLSLKTLREAERNLGVYIGEPKRAVRGGEQYGIFDENEIHAGDVCAKHCHFENVDELMQAIYALNVWETPDSPRRRAGTGGLGSG